MGRARGAVEKQPASTRSLVPAIAGVGVLGVAVAAYFATRGPDKPAVSLRNEEPPVVQPGEIAVEIVSIPPGAEVKTDHVVGTTPMSLPLAAGAQATLIVTKPGYLPITRTVRAEPDKPQMFELTAVTGFNGTWRMKNGELRWFERAGEQVSVYKLTEVAGRREFFKNYKFAPVDKGIAFAADDEIVDPRKPEDPNCHVPVHVEYRYDPQEDVLELRREKVSIDMHAGSCVVRKRHVETDLLVHVDRARDEVEISAPVGVPIQKPTTKQKKVLPKDPQAELDKKRKLEEAKKLASAKKQNVVQKPTAPDNDPFTSTASKNNDFSKNSQIAPEPQVSAPMPNAEPQLQQQAVPQQQKK
jgi:hypothetical protein